MTDPIYADARLAELYDVFEAPRDDLDAYVAVVGELGARRIVDLGCGTGHLALRLATAGHPMTGVDPAAASLTVARSRPGADRVTWIEGDAAAIPIEPATDVVVMTGNAAQTICADDAWRATLRHVHAALAPGGCFVFESRRPEQRAWQEWADRPEETVQVPGLGPVHRRLSVTEVAPPLVTYRYTFRFVADGRTVVSDSTIRFRTRMEVEAELRRAGFRVLDVREAPDRPGREFVFLARRS